MLYNINSPAVMVTGNDGVPDGIGIGIGIAIAAVQGPTARPDCTRSASDSADNAPTRGGRCCLVGDSVGDIAAAGGQSVMTTA